MRTLVLALVALSLIAILPEPALAQQSGSLTMTLQTPETLTPDTTISFVGTVTLVADMTGALQTSGIPVYYTVTAPEWATAIVNPASDVFPPPALGAYGASAAYTVTRTFQITISVTDGPGRDANDPLTFEAWTQPGFLGTSFYGMGQTMVQFDAPEPDEECDHGLTDAQIAALTSEAVEAYNGYEAAKEADASDDVSVQNASATPVPLTGIAIAGFAIVGAGVGLLLRRRLQG